MRIYLAAIALTGTLLAGCSSDWDPARTSTADRAAEQEQLSSLPEAALGARKGPIGFASLPDRGELLSYDRDREVRRSGAYTSHPVEISEEHALNAIAAGGLRLSTPDGKPVNVAFDRIEEHPDGNWSWVGQSGNGDYAVLTFGENAVFGEFSSSGKSYRVTTRRGTAFIVETDPALLAGHPGHHGDGPEFLIPPATGDSAHGAAGAKAMAASESIAAPKAASAVIDLAIGYTNGMVATYGNEATVITRLTSLVALGNQAYQRSGVNMRLRLVRALQVNFPDNTENADALRKLTGYNETTRQRTPPDPAFNALRTAREEYGADLVALVRQHRSPEQKGCGIAWLIGANQRQITSADEEFGYSVVSDGTDLDEGDNNTYFCSEYSLVHELGHNMGQAHNQEDSQYAGVHAYSYGFRESSSSGIHTIMAYPIANSSQQEVPYFATPLISYAAGRPLGVANVADNVRSMNETMPIVSTFRATRVPHQGRRPRIDMDGDGRSDIVWRNPTTGQTSRWYMNGPSLLGGQADSQSPAWRIVGIGDFDGDGKDDLLWANSNNTSLIMWRPDANNQYVGSFVASYPAGGWEIAGIGDMNGDGRSDIVWRNPTTGQTSRWYMNGPSVIGGQADSQSAAWRIVAIGDFDGDGKDDLLWVNNTNSSLIMWRPDANNQYVGSAVASYPAGGWEIAGIGDMNGDGRSDIVWRNPTTGQTSRWYMNGPSVIGGQADSQSPIWRIVAIGDFDGDGKDDLLWANNSNTSLIMWRPDANNQYVGSAVASYPAGGWVIARTGQ